MSNDQKYMNGRPNPGDPAGASDYMPQNASAAQSPYVRPGRYDVLPEHVEHRQSYETDTQQEVYGRGNIKKPNIGSLATAPLETMSSSEAYKGYKMVGDAVRPVADVSEAVLLGASSFLSKENFIYHTSHEEAIRALEKERITYVLSEKGLEKESSGITNSVLISKAKAQTSAYLESHGIHVDTLSKSAMMRAIENGKLGEQTFSRAERDVLREHFNLLHAEKAMDKASTARARVPRNAYKMAQRPLRDSYVMQGKNLAARGLNAGLAAGHGVFVAATRTKQGASLLRNRASAARANRLSDKADAAKKAGNKDLAKSLSKKEELIRERLQKRQKALNNRVRRRNRFEKRFRKFRSRGFLGKAVYVATGSVKHGAKGVAKATRLDKSALYKKMSELNHKRRIRRLARARKFMGDGAGGGSFVGRFLRRITFMVVKNPIVLAGVGLLLVLIIGVVIPLSIMMMWKGTNPIDLSSKETRINATTGEEEEVGQTLGQRAIDAMYQVQREFGGLTPTSSGAVDLEKLKTMNLLQVTMDGEPLPPAIISGGIDKVELPYIFEGDTEVIHYDNFAGFPEPDRPTPELAYCKNPVTIRYHHGSHTSTQTVFRVCDVDQYIGAHSIPAVDGKFIAGWSDATEGTNITLPTYAKVDRKFLRKVNGNTIDLYAHWQDIGPFDMEVDSEDTHTQNIRFATPEEIEASANLPKKPISIKYEYVKRESGDSELTTTEDRSEAKASQKDLYKMVLGAAITIMPEVADEDDQELFIKLCKKLMEDALSYEPSYRVDYYAFPMAGTKGTEEGVTWKGKNGNQVSADGVTLAANITVYPNVSAKNFIKSIAVTSAWIRANETSPDPDADVEEIDFKELVEQSVEQIDDIMEMSDEEFKEEFNIAAFPGIGTGRAGRNVSMWLNEIAEHENYDLSEGRINFLKCLLEDVGRYTYIYGGGHGAMPNENTVGLDCSGFVSWELYRSGVDEKWNPRTTVGLRSEYLPSSHEDRRPGDIMVWNSYGGDIDHVVVYAGWFTNNGRYGEWVVQSSGGVGSNVAPYAGHPHFMDYAYVRAIDNITGVDCREYLPKPSEASPYIPPPGNVLSQANIDFIDAVAPGAVATYNQYGVLPSITIAQAILESGWGRSTLSTQGKNLFGIKAGSGWGGASVTMLTGEWTAARGNYMDYQPFRAYASWDDSIMDHGEVLANAGWYDRVLAADNYRDQAIYLIHTGHFGSQGEISYASGEIGASGLPKYSESLIRLIEDYHLYQWDTGEYMGAGGGNADLARVALNSTATSTFNDCARWVMLVLQEYGYSSAPYWSGATYWERYANPSHTINNIPTGAIVIGTGHESDTEGKGYYYGHIGISVGDIDGDGVMDIRDSQGTGAAGVKISDIHTWVSWQTDTQLGSQKRASGFVGWLDPKEIFSQRST